MTTKLRSSLQEPPSHLQAGEDERDDTVGLSFDFACAPLRGVPRIMEAGGRIEYVPRQRFRIAGGEVTGRDAVHHDRVDLGEQEGDMGGRHGAVLGDQHLRDDDNYFGADSSPPGKRAAYVFAEAPGTRSLTKRRLRQPYPASQVFDRRRALRCDLGRC
jgi:hypothetical protein